jgi:uncharacterized membrane protein YqhA
MVRLLLPLRFLMLLACMGALLGAVLMFGLAGLKLWHSAEVLWASGSGQAGEITAAVMGATDACLFGVVLIIFTYAIAFGFVYQPTKEVGETIPAWMQIHGVRELKHALIEVIIVYLVVDFATDLATGDRDLVWQTLVKPVPIVLIAAALRLMAAPSHSNSPASGTLPSICNGNKNATSHPEDHLRL